MATPSNPKEHNINTKLKVAFVEANKNISSNKNFVCSPVGIEILLSMVAAGSLGETRQQIMQFFGSKTVKPINKKALRIMDVVSPDIDGKGCRRPLVSFVNGAWVHSQHFSLRPSFQELLEGTYKAQAKAVNFARKEEVSEEVNLLWTSKETQGLIDQFISPDNLDQDSTLILGNAVYFNAAWEHPLTYHMNRPFHLLTGGTVDASFISHPCYNQLFEGAFFDTFQLVRIPYKRVDAQDTRNFGMYIFLPNTQNGLVDLVQRFSEDSSLLEQKIELKTFKFNAFWIPKFKLAHAFSAKNTMKQLGLDRMFMNAGELTRIADKTSDKLLYVSDVYQKSYVNVNEEGPVATSRTYGSYVASHFDYVSFFADHPFMFMIREETSGVTLFVGTVLNPLLD